MFLTWIVLFGTVGVWRAARAIADRSLRVGFRQAIADVAAPRHSTTTSPATTASTQSRLRPLLPWTLSSGMTLHGLDRAILAAAERVRNVVRVLDVGRCRNYLPSSTQKLFGPAAAVP